MEEFLSVVILAVVQGVAEFLPISSSGHLVLVGHLVGLPSEEATLEVVLHLGTLAAVLLFFRRRLQQLVVDVIKNQNHGRRLALALIIGTIPAGMAGYLLQDFFAEQFSSLLGTGCWLMVTGLALTFLGGPPRGETRQLPTIVQALIIGLAQAMAILPGISRSGATIIAGMRTGLDRRPAGEFSFFLSIPVIMGAGVLKLRAIGESSLSMSSLLAGAVISAGVGLGCLWLLMWLLAKGRMRIFAPWCLVAGVTAITLWYFKETAASA